MGGLRSVAGPFPFFEDEGEEPNTARARGPQHPPRHRGDGGLGAGLHPQYPAAAASQRGRQPGTGDRSGDGPVFPRAGRDRGDRLVFRSARRDPGARGLHRPRPGAAGGDRFAGNGRLLCDGGAAGRGQSDAALQHLRDLRLDPRGLRPGRVALASPSRLAGDGFRGHRAAGGGERGRAPGRPLRAVGALRCGDGGVDRGAAAQSGASLFHQHDLPGAMPLDPRADRFSRRTETGITRRRTSRSAGAGGARGERGTTGDERGLPLPDGGDGSLAPDAVAGGDDGGRLAALRRDLRDAPGGGGRADPGGDLAGRGETAGAPAPRDHARGGGDAGLISRAWGVTAGARPRPRRGRRHRAPRRIRRGWRDAGAAGRNTAPRARWRAWRGRGRGRAVRA